MKLISFISCEDVRRELDNKVSLLGVFEGLIVQPDAFAKGPAIIRVATHLRFQIEEGDQIPDEASVVITLNGDLLARADSLVVVGDREVPVTYASTMMMLPIARPGTVAFAYRFRAEGKDVWTPPPFAFTVQFPPQPPSISGS